MEEIKMISKALNFYAKAGGTDFEIQRRENGMSWLQADTLGLDWRFDELATGSHGRARKRFLNRGS